MGGEEWNYGIFDILMAVAETGSLTAAARAALHTSQPSLSRQIRELEDQVGVELLSRGARGVQLTAAGRAFMDHARLALTQVDRCCGGSPPCGTTGQTEVCAGLLTGMEMTWATRSHAHSS